MISDLCDLVIFLKPYSLPQNITSKWIKDLFKDYKYAYEAVITEDEAEAKQKEKTVETKGRVGDKATTFVMGHKMLCFPKDGPHTDLALSFLATNKKRKT